MISSTTFQNLIKEQPGLVTSIYLPIHEAAVAELGQDRIRLRNLLDTAESDLIELGVSQREVESRLRQAREILKERPFWQHQKQGLAVFISKDETSWHHLPKQVEELSVTARRYHIKPLVPMLAADQQFYVLRLSPNRVDLFRATLENIEEVGSDKVPANITEALGEDDPERQLQNHAADTGGGPANGAIYHGQGGAKDQQDADPPRFVRAVADEVLEIVNQDPAPVVFAGDDKLFSLARETDLNKHLLENSLSGNHDARKPFEIHELAVGLIEPKLTDKQDIIGRYHQLKANSPELVVEDIESIVQCAKEGKIEQLLYDTSIIQWGKPGEGMNVTRLKQRRPGAIDLVDMAIADTYAHGGEASALGQPELNNESVVAILRY